MIYFDSLVILTSKCVKISNPSFCSTCRKGFAFHKGSGISTRWIQTLVHTNLYIRSYCFILQVHVNLLQVAWWRVDFQLDGAPFQSAQYLHYHKCQIVWYWRDFTEHLEFSESHGQNHMVHVSTKRQKECTFDTLYTGWPSLVMLVTLPQIISEHYDSLIASKQLVFVPSFVAEVQLRILAKITADVRDLCRQLLQTWLP